MVENLDFGVFEPHEISAMSPLSLAYIGDAVWEIYARQYILFNYKNSKVNKLHKLTTDLVKAHAQFIFAEHIKQEDIIDEQLWEVVLRGRNASHNPPKNADVQEYNYATGFETLIGYLYLTGNKKKIDEIAEFCLKNYDKWL